MSKKVSTKKQKAIENRFLLLSIFFSLTAVFLISLRDIYFSISNIKVYLYSFFIPITIIENNYLIKKFGFKKNLLSLTIMGLILVLYTIIIENLINQRMELLYTVAPMLTFVFSLLVNSLIYYYIIFNMNEKLILIGLGSIFTVIVNYFLFLLLVINIPITSLFWKELLLGSISGIIVSLITTYFDSKIKRGI